ncbi:2-succinyl-6-hydroxy-2,4-cyclohexadiene-1-carboxylate synthase [Pectobacterium sp. B1J-3]|uniref:2-succinyl-6-hydroxy-2, 4-cyclohexadiene-1-carboxylate synthase n=1 Tax=Pectobacterium sp. B1J-3 TaxID=3385371 RepID=UPI0039058DD6
MVELRCQRLVPSTPLSDQPWLICLHGLLGSAEDWQPILPYCDQLPLLLIDLPGHGASQDVNAVGFAQVSQQLTLTLAQQGIDRYWLLGYSLGGRIAMYHACFGQHHGMQGLLVEGGNPGLEDVRQREARLLHDARWAQRFRHEVIEAVLNDWYQQTVFADLDASQRQKLIARRCHNQGAAVAAMLEATSLGHQPCLVDKLRQLTIPFGYLCGERDAKFQALAMQYALPLLRVTQAGHNAHQANPAEYAARILSFISHPVKD